MTNAVESTMNAAMLGAQPRLNDDPVSFRADLHDWLSAHVPRDWRDKMRGASREDYVRFQREWMEQLRVGGYLAPDWDPAWGGAGLTFDQQFIFYQEMARSGAPRLPLFMVGLHHTYHTLIAEGSEEQRRRYLPGVLRGEVWCQGFSEPNAGSDLAALRTRATRKGDDYVVNGQKIWSSGAENARWCLLLVRTDPQAPKHRGITYLICDMTSKGVDVRPIKQANGNQEFAEVFFTDVVIPAENRIGNENDGWRIAQVTLASERGPAAVELAERLSIAYRGLLALSVERFGTVGDIPTEIAVDLGDLGLRARTLNELCLRSIEAMRSGEGTGWESSVVKLCYSELTQRLNHIGVQIAGLDGQSHVDSIQGESWMSGNWMLDYIGSFEWTIAGGANEIQRNLLAERVLGLPREPKWSTT